MRRSDFIVRTEYDMNFPNLTALDPIQIDQSAGCGDDVLKTRDLEGIL